MTRHPVDATALIFGLLFAVSGSAIVTETAWPEVDTAAAVGLLVAVFGIVFITVLVLRQTRSTSQTEPSNRSETDSDPAATE